MAEILEESYHAEKHHGKEEMGGKHSTNLHAKAPLGEKEEIEVTTKGKKEVKKLTDEEVRERMKKGLCFKCGEKWAPGHKCTTGQVFLIVEASDDDEVARVVESEEETSLSFHAMMGIKAPNTFRLFGWIGEHEVTVLVDTGSSHNFISSTVAARTGLQGTRIGPLLVRVASGDELRCEEVIREVEMHVQGVPLTVDFFVLQLPCLDVVLGVTWLKSVGRVQMDYGRMIMKFIMRGKKQKWVADFSRVSLEDKGVFEGEGNVAHQPTGDRQPEERTCDMDQSGELDPGGVHDMGRSGEEDPG